MLNLNAFVSGRIYPCYTWLDGQELSRTPIYMIATLECSLNDDVIRVFLKPLNTGDDVVFYINRSRCKHLSPDGYQVFKPDNMSSPIGIILSENVTDHREETTMTSELDKFAIGNTYSCYSLTDNGEITKATSLLVVIPRKIDFVASKKTITSKHIVFKLRSEDLFREYVVTGEKTTDGYLVYPVLSCFESPQPVGIIKFSDLEGLSVSIGQKITAYQMCMPGHTDTSYPHPFTVIGIDAARSTKDKTCYTLSTPSKPEIFLMQLGDQPGHYLIYTSQQFDSSDRLPGYWWRQEDPAHKQPETPEAQAKEATMQEATKTHQVNPAILKQIRSMLLSTRVVYKDGQLMSVLIDQVGACDEVASECGETLSLLPGHFRIEAVGTDNFGAEIRMHTIINANALDSKLTVDWVESGNLRRNVVIWNDVVGAYIIADENMRSGQEYGYAMTQILHSDFLKLTEKFPEMFTIHQNRVTYAA